MKMKIFVSIAVLVAGVVLLNVASKPSSSQHSLATFSTTPASPQQPLETQVAAMLDRALSQAGQTWPEDAFDSAVGGVAAAVRETGLEPSLVLSLIQAESCFRLAAVSPRGAVGLTQILPATARNVAQGLGLPSPSRRDLLDPATNIRLGAGYLAQLQRQYGSLDAALAAYNGGPGVFSRAVGPELPLRGYRREVQNGAREMARWLKSP